MVTIKYSRSSTVEEDNSLCRNLSDGFQLTNKVPSWEYVRSVKNFYNQITDFLTAWSGQKRKTIFTKAGRSKVDRFCWDSMWYDPSSSFERTTAKTWYFSGAEAHSFIMFTDALILSYFHAASFSNLANSAM